MDSIIKRAMQRWPIDTIILAQASALAVAAAGLLLGGPPLAIAIAAALTTALLLLRARGRHITTWLSLLVGQRPTSPEAPTLLGHDVVLYPGGDACAALEITSAPLSPTAASPGSHAGAAPVPLAVLADALIQYDIALSGIDIIVRGSSSAPGHPLGTAYSRILSALPVAAQRRAWIVLRLDPFAQRDAVARRGGGARGTRQALDIAARRLQRMLRAEGLGTVRCTGTSLAGLRSDLEPINRTAGIQPGALTTDHLLRAWQPAAIDSALALSLCPSEPTSNPAAGSPLFEIYGVVGHAMPADGMPRFPRTISTVGQRPLAALALVPGSGYSAKDIVGRDGIMHANRADLAALRVPVTGCGQLIGVDQHDRAISIPVASRTGTHVRVTGQFSLAQQVVLRSAATGAQVRIATDRPHSWQALVGLGPAGQIGFADQEWREPRPSDPLLLVLDGLDAAATPPVGTAIVAVDDTARQDSAAEALGEPDVHLVQSPQAPQRLRLVVGSRHVDLTAVAIPEETDYVTRSIGARAAPAPAG
ncbi:type VII secretion protein EccE [Hoyosella sp. G463]|uniref:Type VII secretion protein EccE n=1 Tax=Lolliginicoccus lacisalsi TaxID=2742202 RepID=A0A927JC62_9ACTN|nr:type VII secretion protein EccE [Lolliginicoccus lacisalsi]MBD8506413.1 type VII secretion protein EccE [Lolliginicoccus lacisalsi]